MATLSCIECGAPLKAENVNVAADVASCHKCGAVFKASAAANASPDPAQSSFNVEDTPSGVRFRQSPAGFRIKGTTRSAMALIYIPFTAVWAGFSLTHLYIAPILSGAPFGFLQLFGIPFLIGSAVLFAMCAMAVAGEIRVVADGYRGRVFTGVGPIGWYKNFDWRDIDTIEEVTTAGARGRETTRLHLEGRRRISFGYGLNDGRRYYFLMAIREMLRRLKQVEAANPSKGYSGPGKNPRWDR